MRIIGWVLIVFGLLLCLTIVGAFAGVPMILIGFVMLVAGGRRKTVINNVVQVSNNGPSPQFSMDNNDRYDRRARDMEPVARGGFSEPRLARTERQSLPPPVPEHAEFEPTYDDEDFKDVRTELSPNSKRILGRAKQDGFEVKARPDSITLRRADAEDVLRSNHAVNEFGRAHGYS